MPQQRDKIVFGNGERVALDMLRQIVAKIEAGEAICSAMSVTPEYDIQTFRSLSGQVNMARAPNVNMKFEFDVMLDPAAPPFIVNSYPASDLDDNAVESPNAVADAMLDAGGSGSPFTPKANESKKQPERKPLPLNGARQLIFKDD